MKILFRFWRLVFSFLVQTAMLTLVCFCAFGQDSVQGDAPRVFMAGAAKSNITPFLGDEIVGGFSPIPTAYIHDELHVRCLVLADGEEKLAFGVIDNVFVKQEVLDSAKALVFEMTSIPVSHVMLSATHTHTATSAGGKGNKRVAWTLGEPFDEYQQFLIKRIADGIVRAVNNLEPARIGWGSAPAPEHVFNRRWRMKAGTRLPNPFGGEDHVLMNPGRNNPGLLEPAGLVDPEVFVLAIQSVDGHPIAVLANYSLHYVGGVPSGHVSADYFGAFARNLGRLMRTESSESDFVAMMSNGTSADVNNTDVQNVEKKYAPYQKMEMVAKDLAQKVHAVYQSVKFEEWVPLSAKQNGLKLAVRKPTASMLDRAHRLSDLPTDSFYHRNEHIYSERLIDMANNWPDTIGVPMQVFRIGELAVAAIPFEVFAETGLELKQRSPFEKTVVLGLANGGHGYLPTPEQHALGGYETWVGTNRVEKQASVKIVDALLGIMNTIR